MTVIQRLNTCVLILAAIASASPVSAFPTLKSEPSNSIASGKAGLTYFLPERFVKVTVANSVAAVEQATAALKTAQEALVAAGKAQESAETEEEQAAAKVAYEKADKAVADAKAALSTLKKQPCQYTTTFELQPPQPDTTQQFNVTPEHSIFRDENTVFGVSSNGLLTSANATVTDRTGEVISTFAGNLASLGNPDKAHGLTPAKDSSGGCAETVKKTWSYIVDPTSAVSVKKLNENLSAKNLKINFLKSDMKTALDRPASAADGKGSVLYYRVAVPVVMVIQQKEGDIWTDVVGSILSVPQAGPVSYIPMNAPRFVKTVSDVKFTEGSVTSWTVDHPSEALTIVSLPVNILKAIVSVPGEILSVKVKYSTDAKGLAENQKAQFETAERLQIVKSCVSEAKTLNDDDAVLKCFEAKESK